jgi:hypothetical protein
MQRPSIGSQSGVIVMLFGVAMIGSGCAEQAARESARRAAGGVLAQDAVQGRPTAEEGEHLKYGEGVDWAAAGSPSITVADRAKAKEKKAGAKLANAADAPTAPNDYLATVK